MRILNHKITKFKSLDEEVNNKLEKSTASSNSIRKPDAKIEQKNKSWAKSRVMVK